ncbi:MAG: exodeoxyribonuclease VII large subunit [Firmicutes bacterium]|nr:exodeoxyribonuclease VII large subunit [Bacillota bacterium]
MKPVTVTELVAALRRLIEGVPEWQRLMVVGELSGVKHHTSGHWYFTLKDENAQIRAVMFRRDAETLTFPLEDGQQVLATGRLGVFERDGQTQLYVSRVTVLGSGWQYRQLELLKQRLFEEGLFSRPKRPLPRVPRAVAVITSENGAARHDIETVIQRRYPGMPVRLLPVTVQGREAPQSIVEALMRIHPGMADVVIIGRGGGAKEDLAAFNDELVVRAVFHCPVPVISAVGHEIDTTLVDLVADVRAPTPSAAAELAVPELEELLRWHQVLGQRLDHALAQRLQWERDRLQGWVEHGLLAHPDSLFREYRHRLDRLDERRDRAFERQWAEWRHRAETLTERLALLDPALPLARGYAYVTDREGQLVTRRAIEYEQRYRVQWDDGACWVQPIAVKGDGDE